MFRNTDTFPHITVPFSTEEPFISHTPDVYIPFFTLIEFISYMGWIKVRQEGFYDINVTYQLSR